MKTIHELIMNLPSLTSTGVAITCGIGLIALIALTVCVVWIARLRRVVRKSHDHIKSLERMVCEKGNDVFLLTLHIKSKTEELQHQQTAYESRIKALNEQIKQSTDNNRHAALDHAVRAGFGVDKAKEYYRFLQGKL